MSARTHLLDLMELPPLQRRLIQLLLRRGTMLESDLSRMIRVLPEGEELTSAEFDTMLEALERAGWLIKNVEGDEPRYRVRFSQKMATVHHNFWDKLSLESIRQHWHIKLTVMSQTAPADEDFLMRRGGKRTLSKAIWDKLEDTPKTETPAASTETKSRTTGLFDALEHPKEKPFSDKKDNKTSSKTDIRKKLWDALEDDDK